MGKEMDMANEHGIDMSLYLDFKKEQDESDDSPVKVFEQHGFAAFNSKQFEEGLQKLRETGWKDETKVVYIGSGCYIAKDWIDAYIDGHEKTQKALRLKFNDEEFAAGAILYEMNNHEYAINWEGDFDVIDSFNLGPLEYSEDAYADDYWHQLNMGTPTVLSAWLRAKREHMRQMEEFGVI